MQPVSVHNPVGQGCAEGRLLGGVKTFNWHGSPESPLHRGWSWSSVAQVMQSINHQIGVCVDAVVGFPGVGVVAGLNGLIDPFAVAQAQQGLRRDRGVLRVAFRGGAAGWFTEQVAGDRSGVSSAAVLPEVNGLPGAQQQLAPADAQVQGLAGEGGSDGAGMSSAPSSSWR